MMTDDGNTWVAELQNGGEFNHEDTFSVSKSPTGNGSRIATTHKNKWSRPVWASKVKTIAAAIMIKACDRYRNRRARQRARNTADQKECGAVYAHKMEGLLGAWCTACWQDQSIDL
jgi:hypothetical protein